MEIFPIIIPVFTTVGGLCHHHRLDDAGAGVCRWLYLHHNLHGGNGGLKCISGNYKVKALWLCNLLQLATLVGGISRNYFIVICILCGVYLGCAALRLATYNVHAILEKKSSERFSGLPSPGAAAALCSLVVFSATAQDILPLNCVVKVLPYYAAVLGLLMVSRIPYMHFAKWIVSCKRNKRRLAFLLFLFAAWAVSGFAYHFFFGKYNWYAFPALVINIYVFWGPIAYFAVKMGILSSVRLEENA